MRDIVSASLYDPEVPDKLTYSGRSGLVVPDKSRSLAITGTAGDNASKWIPEPGAVYGQ